MKIPSSIGRRLRPFFYLKKSEQRGILMLAALIIISMLINLFLPFLASKDDIADDIFEKEVATFLARQQRMKDSVRIIEMQNRGGLGSELAKKKLTPFSFNPNLASRKDWLDMGLTEKQATTIKNYLKKGGSFKKKTDLSRIYCISDAEYEILAPFITIPGEASMKRQTNPEDSLKKDHTYWPVELNSADSAELVERLHFKSWLAARIIKYRELLGGFYEPTQLFEVYGLDSNDVMNRMDYLSADTNLVRKLNINSLSFSQLLRHPYISYELTQHIMNSRRETGKITPEMFSDSGLLTAGQFRKLSPYVTFD